MLVRGATLGFALMNEVQALLGLVSNSSSQKLRPQVLRALIGCLAAQRMLLFCFELVIVIIMHNRFGDAIVSNLRYQGIPFNMV